MTGFYDRPISEQLVEIQRLAQASLSKWNFTNCKLSLIKHRENSVFELNCDQGRYALRVHRAGYNCDKALQGELYWISSLNESGISVPTPIKSINNKLYEKCQLDSIPEPVLVDIVTWLHGNSFGSVEDILAGKSDESKLAASYEKAGELAAKIHNHAQTFELSKNAIRQSWDEDGLLGDDPIWGRGWDNSLLTSDAREIIVEAKNKAIKQLSTFGKGTDRYSLIHADFLPENLFINGDDIEVIDFDDSGYGWHMFEIATALFWYLDEPAYKTIYECFVKGYRKHRQLSQEQLDMLQTFITIRGIVYLGWMQTRKETEIVQELGSVVVPRVVKLAKRYVEEV